MAKPIRPGRPGWKHRSPSAQRTAPLVVAVFNLALTLGAPNGRRCQTLELQGSGIAGRGFSLEVGSPLRWIRRGRTLLHQLGCVLTGSVEREWMLGWESRADGRRRRVGLACGRDGKVHSAAWSRGDGKERHAT